MPLLAVIVACAVAAPPALVRVPAGTVLPFFKDEPARGAAVVDADAAPKPQAVPPFLLQATPVTNADFAAFVRSHKEWRRSKAPRLFVDAGYLAGWSDDVTPGPSLPPRAPVTQVSWFAARAYCQSRGLRLPTTAEWERAAQGETPVEQRATAEAILRWYSTPQPAVLGDVGKGAPNALGVYDLFGLVWEWTEDWNADMVADDGRGGADAFCGSGGARARDPNDTATFLRAGFRSSLKAAYTVRNLGFRCAKDP